jgi:hypothetical protein
VAPLRDNAVSNLGSIALSTTAVPAFTPAANKRISCTGGQVAAIAAGADLVIQLTDGTAAAAGTLATFVIDSAGAPTYLDFGQGGIQATGTRGLGIKTLASAGTVGGFLRGREERTN